MLINYLPPILKEIKEFQVLMSDEDVEKEKLFTTVADLEANQYITSVTEDAISRYEKMLKLSSKDTETLEDRRFRVLAKYNKKLPYTRIRLADDLSTLCGKDGYSLSIDYEKHKLTVKVALTVKDMFQVVADYLETVVPLNMMIDLVLLYNTWNMVGEKLSWEKANTYTWEQLREDVI
ncbi:putative phage tail protein [Anaeromicropila herbilytica]|uniref:DUF2313 domain-containing protein n=1 Tax=Anaeromicropila herbilytica TaxID=2785025 RepID=A0A7R7IEJ1_9FIRM|nr:putative phage tail protein [Anaeromicropila herbilytica]BCN32061.1 hypothetical protein bsdtb5_33560 [Anaeromicropila herbilytica]